jgi:hypothetical protein
VVNWVNEEICTGLKSTPIAADLGWDAHIEQQHEIATNIAYQNGALRGTPKGKWRDCREVTDAAVLPTGYAVSARKIADRRMMLAGYRLTDLLQRISAN